MLTREELIFFAGMTGVVVLCFILGWLTYELLDDYHRRTMKW